MRAWFSSEREAKTLPWITLVPFVLGILTALVVPWLGRAIGGEGDSPLHFCA